MEITNIAADSLDIYFNTIAHTGYRKYNEIERLLILLFIEELLTSDYHYFINEEDYKVICNVINCMLGSSCLITMPLYESLDSLLHENKLDLELRITEDSILKLTENDILRTKS